MYEPYVELAARLSALVGEGRKAVLFTPGAEGDRERGQDCARAYQALRGRRFSGGFHGRTLLALTMTASSPAYRQNFGPFASDVYHAPFPDDITAGPPRRPSGAGGAVRHRGDAGAGRRGRHRTGARRGRFVPAPPAFCGAARITRTVSASSWSPTKCRAGSGGPAGCSAISTRGSQPDLIVMAKSLAAGSAAVGGGRHGRDHGRAAARRTRRHLWRQPALLRIRARRARRVRGRGTVRAGRDDRDQIRAALLRLQARVPRIGDVRGLGAMLAIELVKDPATKEPDPEWRSGSSMARGIGDCCC